MIADTCCSVADTLYICIHEHHKLSTKYITHESTTRCCHLRPRHRLAALSALASYFSVLSARTWLWRPQCSLSRLGNRRILFQITGGHLPASWPSYNKLIKPKRVVLVQSRQPKTYDAKYFIVNNVNCVSGGVCHP